MLSAATANAFGPYTAGQNGYDVSYPQCTSRAYIPNGTFQFGIVGVNGGRPFTSNACFGGEYGVAPNPSLYINTGYSGAYRKDIRPACSTAPSSYAGATAQAWEIGCSEADYSAQLAGTRAVAMWWLDVETGNSWSSSSLALNQDTIQGAIDRLRGAAPVGVYSTAAMWKTITGGAYTPTNVAGDWVAGATCQSATPFMPNTTVWLTQTVSNGVDYDTAC